jgi:hypothetical protein
MGLAGDSSVTCAATPAIDSEKQHSGADDSLGKDEQSEFASGRKGRRRIPRAKSAMAGFAPVTH